MEEDPMKIMRIGVHHKDVQGPKGKFIKMPWGRRVFVRTARLLHQVHWGTTAQAYNRNHKGFSRWDSALRFAQSLSDKYKALGYSADVQKIVD